MSSKPTILWLADGPGWAYDQIFQHQSRALPAYDHEVFYMMSRKNEPLDWVNMGFVLERADIVVCMHLMYFVQIEKMKGEKVVAMLTGPRVWE